MFEGHDERDGAVAIPLALARSPEAKGTARELFLTVAIGYLKTSHDRIEKDPDRRVQEAIALVFVKFAELQTVRQVHLWMRHERLPLPATEYGPEGRP